MVEKDGEVACCSICYEPKCDAVYYIPCGHSFCRQCAAKALKFRPVCPLCRRDCAGLVSEGAGGLGAPPSGTVARGYFTRVVVVECTIRLGSGRHAGLTLTDSNGFVVVQRMRDQSALSGLHVGDRVLSMNGVPCVHHADAVRLVDAATIAPCDVRVRALRHTWRVRVRVRSFRMCK
jgi:hypothetical protein